MLLDTVTAVLENMKPEPAIRAIAGLQHEDGWYRAGPIQKRRSSN